MGKIKIGPSKYIYPLPVLLVGTVVNGKPNFMTVSYGSMVSNEPPTALVALNHSRHTLVGINQNKVFSINVPAADQVRETDYCGTSKGTEVDKVKTCRFNIFFGKLEKAPLIEQCPVNMECSVIQIVNASSHALVIGRIEETHVSEECLTGGKPDINKLNPMAFLGTIDPHYFTLGKPGAMIGQPGKELKGRG